MSHGCILKRSWRWWTHWRGKRSTFPVMNELNLTSFFQLSFNLVTWVVIRPAFDFLIQHFEKVLLTRRNVAKRARNNWIKTLLDGMHFNYASTYCSIGPFFFRIGIITSLLFGSGELLSDNCKSSSIFSFSLCCESFSIALGGEKVCGK